MKKLYKLRNSENRQALSSENPLQLKTFLGKGKFFVFDEAQKVSNIGI